MHKIRKKWKRILIKACLSILALAYILPLLLIFTNSFMSEGEITKNYSETIPIYERNETNDTFHYAEYKLVPEKVTFAQYYTLLFKSPIYLDYFMNSIKITVPIVVGQLILGVTAGYGFVFGKFRYKELLFCIYIIVMLLPFQATSVANFIIADKLHIMESYLAIILPMVFSPFPVFIMRQSMRGIHPDIINAARLEGAGNLQVIFYILVPMVKGGIVSLFLLSFCECWGMVEQAVVFIRDASKEPLSLFLSNIGGDKMGLIFAASVFYMLPVVWVFIYGQEYFEQGIKLSVLK